LPTPAHLATLGFTLAWFFIFSTWPPARRHLTGLTRCAKRLGAKTDTKSGITNDANDYATETVGDPRYPFDLLCRVITVSLETVNIVNGLPKLDI
jgi:hypothetical protein